MLPSRQQSFSQPAPVYGASYIVPKKPAVPPAPTIGSIVEVIWVDAAFDLDTEPPLYTLRTYGFLRRHDETCIVVAGEGDGSYFRGFTSIPANWVRSIRVLLPA